MLGTRGIRAKLTAVRGAETPAPAAGSQPSAEVRAQVDAELRERVHADVPAQPQPLSNLATAGVAALDILPARSGRGLCRRRATSSPALAAGAPVAALASSVPVPGAAQPVPPAGGEITAPPVGAGPMTGPVTEGMTQPTTEPTTVPSLFLAGPAEVADERIRADVEGPVSARELDTEPTPVLSFAKAESADVPVAASWFAGAGGPAQEPEPALSSLFAPTPPAMVPVAEIVPTVATSAPSSAAGAAESPASLFASVPAEPTSGTRDMPVGAGALSPGGPHSVTSGPVPVVAAAQSLRERSAMASEALSELSALSSYRSEGQPGTTAPRRAPQTPAGTPEPPAQGEESLGARRGTRNAADVRSMLSGFRSGGEEARAAAGRSVPAQLSVADHA